MIAVMIVADNLGWPLVAQFLLLKQPLADRAGVPGRGLDVEWALEARLAVFQQVRAEDLLGEYPACQDRRAFQSRAD